MIDESGKIVVKTGETKLFKWEREREESQKMEIGYVKYRRENDRKCQTSLLKSYSTTFSKDVLMLRSAKGGRTKISMYFSIIFSKQLLEENISQPIKWTIFDSIQIETEITNKFYFRIPVINSSINWTTQIINWKITLEHWCQ